MRPMLLKLALCVLAVVTLLQWGWAIAQIGALPAQLPTRFSGSGAPLAWAPATVMVWLSLPLVGLGVTGVMLGALWITRWFSRSAPHLVNIPLKERWLPLPPEVRMWCMEPIVTALALSAVLCASLFWTISWQTLEVGTGRQATAPIWPPVVFVTLMLVLMIGSIPLIARRIRTASNGL